MKQYDNVVIFGVEQMMEQLETKLSQVVLIKVSSIMLTRHCSGAET